MPIQIYAIVIMTDHLQTKVCATYDLVFGEALYITSTHQILALKIDRWFGSDRSVANLASRGAGLVRQRSCRTPFWIGQRFFSSAHTVWFSWRISRTARQSWGLAHKAAGKSIRSWNSPENPSLTGHDSNGHNHRSYESARPLDFVIWSVGTTCSSIGHLWCRHSE